MSRKFGESIDGFSIPVLNEREIRAAAGILFLIMFIAILTVIYTADFTMLKFVVVIFLSDMLIRVFISPSYSPVLILGRFIVRNQTPEYVSAEPKKFAWWIGVGLASMIFVLSVVQNTFSPITGLSCFICLIFLFFESAFGICLGCKFYSVVYRRKPELCPGEVCTPSERTKIQMVSGKQKVILIGFIIYITALIYLLNEVFAQKPSSLF